MFKTEKIDKKSGFHGIGPGVGYVSVMIIFAVICLTIFAVMSLKAASSNDAFNERSGEYLKQYYAADTLAKEKLAELDGCAKAAADSMFFDEAFEETAGAVEGVSLKRIPNGYSAEYSVKINDRQEIAVSADFLNGGVCEITRWQSRTIYAENSDSHLGVWDGSF